MSYSAQAQARSSKGKTELELLQETRKSLAEADEISTKTLVTLHGQSEQLQRIQDDENNINHNLDQSEWLLRGLKPFGWVRNLFRKEPVPDPMAKGGAGIPAGRASGGAQAAPFAPPARKGIGAGVGSGGLDKSAQKLQAQKGVGAGKPGSGRAGQEADLDSIYDEIEGVLDGLAHKSKEINRTLDQHNRIIPDIGERIQSDQDRISKQSKDIQKRIR